MAIVSLSLLLASAKAAYEDWGRYRGVNVGPNITEKDIQDLAATKATVVRASFGAMPLMSKSPPYAFDETAFGQLRKIVLWCERYGLKVIIDPHTAPGLRRAWTCEFEDEFWKDLQWHDRLIALWKRIATEHRSRDNVIVGLDLLNEPATPPGPKKGPTDWNHLVARLVETIRATGNKQTIIVEPTALRSESGEYINRQRGLEYLELPEDHNIVVSPHTYQPFAFTHQGAEGQAVGVKYPGKVGDKEWNRTALLNSLEVIRKFQKKHRVPILIGEFSASRFAGDDGLAYLRDLISLYEEAGWSWTYHDYRTSDEWDPEMTTPNFEKTNRDPAAPRMRLLKEAFSPLPASEKPRT